MVSFVILHYKTINDTIECIESILKLETDKQKSIIVVDNHTLTEKEEQQLTNYPIHLIKLQENLGFAKANNIGCKYAIEHDHPDFLIVSNNDIIIEQKDFIERIYEEEKFDLLGPKIKTDGGQSVNPFPVYKTKEEVINQINKTKKLIKIYKSSILRNLLKIYTKIKSQIKGERLVYNGNTKQKNVALHGCFLIFSKHYYEKYTDVFFNDTFLYHEEEFLYQRIINDHLISIYNPDLEVFHKEGASLNSKYKNEYQKLIFKNEEILKSLLLLEQQMNLYESRGLR